MKKSKIAMGIMVSIIAALLLIGVPICINLCFKPENRWTAGNVLTYYGATLSFLGTVIFSSLSIYQNIQIRKEADKREKILRDMELKKNYPLIKCRLDGYCGNYQNVEISFSNISDNVADNIEISPLIFTNAENKVISTSVNMEPKIDVLKAGERQTVRFSNEGISGENIELQFDIRCTDKFSNQIEYKAICKIFDSSKCNSKISVIQI